jgi:branched-chain amino acid transport system substrate-binding protein
LESKGMTLAIVLLVVGLAVGAGVGYYAMPTKTVSTTETVTVTQYKAPLQGKEIKIGYIASSTTGLETGQPLHKQIIETDMNEYATRLGYQVTFNWLIDDSTGLANVHLEKVQSFKSMGVTVFEGGLWSAQASGSLSYCNENDMLMWSSSSTSPLLMIPDDNLYRMCPTDLVQAPAIAEMLWSYGIKAIVVIQRGDAWADGIYNILATEYPNRGGVILERVRYATEVTEWSSYLQTAENKLSAAVATYGIDRLAVELISFQEGVNIIQATDYPTIYSVKWFGSDGTSMTQQFIDDSPTQAQKLSIYSTLAAPAASEKYSTLYDRYYALVSQPFGYYSACSYDIGTVMMVTMLEKQSSAAKDIIELQSPTCYDTWGASGWCRLNSDGDRYAGNYDIWGYGETPVTNVHFGYYNGVNGQIVWDTASLGFTPLGP